MMNAPGLPSAAAKPMILACVVASALAVLITCSSPPKVPVVDGAIMSITRSDTGLDRLSPSSETELQLSWFGTACHLIQLGELSVLTDPFVSNGLTLTRKLESDPIQFRKTLRLIHPPDTVLVNHTHHDHFQDAYSALSLPTWRARKVPLYGGVTCRNLLAGWSDQDVLSRVHAIDNGEGLKAGEWFQVPIPTSKSSRGYRLRVLPFRSRHTPHLKCGATFLDGLIKDPRTSPPSRITDFQAGEVYNYLVEMKSPSATFRILYLGAPAELNELPNSMPRAEEYPIDVVLALAPSWKNVSEYPREHLLRARARHIVLSHFNTFLKEDSDEVISLFGIDFVEMTELLRKMQAIIADSDMNYPEFEDLLVPAITKIDARSGDMRNVIRISPSRR